MVIFQKLEQKLNEFGVLVQSLVEFEKIFVFKLIGRDEKQNF